MVQDRAREWEQEEGMPSLFFLLSIALRLGAHFSCQSLGSVQVTWLHPVIGRSQSNTGRRSCYTRQTVASVFLENGTVVLFRNCQ